MHSQTSIDNDYQETTGSRSTFYKRLIRLSIKALVLVGSTWLCLHVIDLIWPYGSLKQVQVRIAGSMATIVISFIIITAIRRLLQTTVSKVGPHLSASVSFFIAVTISLIAMISLMYQWNTNPESILVGGGVTAIIVGIGVSTIIGNMLSAGIMLTAFPARIGETINIVNDNIVGKVAEINFIFTKIITNEGAEYVVPNNAIVQGNVRISKGPAPCSSQLPYVEGDNIELKKDSSTVYCGTIIRITSNFTTLLHNENGTTETILANSAILSGNFVILKKISKKESAVSHS